MPGVAAYGVSQRRREINIRVALGAATRDVMRLLIRQSAHTIAIGVVVGLEGALAAGQLTAGMLYEVHQRSTHHRAGHDGRGKASRCQRR